MGDGALFHLRIVASNRVFFDGLSSCVILPSLEGEYALLAHHENVVAAVRPGTLRIRLPEGEWTEAVVGRGFVQAANNRVWVLTDTAERPEDIDEARARAALSRAREELRQKQSMQEYYLSQAAMARALSRLRGKNHTFFTFF